MRAVVDTNVFISALLKQNSRPAEALLAIEQHDTLLRSVATSDELQQTIYRPRLARIIDPSARDWVFGMLAVAELITVAERVAACRDPKDDKFLELAVNGRADVIVSGDADLLALNPFRGIPIETPARFLLRLQRH